MITSSDIFAIMAPIRRPRPKLKPWQWAADSVDSIPYSPVPGGVNLELVPALKPVMESICNKADGLVVLCMSVQSCKSLAMELSLAWSVVNDPGPSMLILPQAPEAADQSKLRLRPLFEATPPVAELIPRGVDRDKATVTSILFKNGMSLWCLGSHPRNLQRRSLRRVMIDECWQLEPGRIREAMARTTAFGFLGKVVLASQGSDSDHEFAKFWESTDKREWTWLCPSCESRHPYRWADIRWDSVKDENGHYVMDAAKESAHMICPTCEHRMEDADETRRDLNAKGRFIAQNKNASRGKVGFHLNAISTMSWGDLVEEYLLGRIASHQGDIGPLRTFHMKRLATFFTEEALDDFTVELKGNGYRARDWREWQDDREEWQEGSLTTSAGQICVRATGAPENGQSFKRLRVMSVDVQRDSFWFLIRSFARDGRSRLLTAGQLFTWQDLQATAEEFEVFSGLVFVDCGFRPGPEVYPECARRGWVALNGTKQADFAHRDPMRKGSSIRRYYSTNRGPELARGHKVRVHHFSSLNCRDVLQRLMSMPERWQLPDDIGEICPDYEPQISSQRRVKNKNGTWTWKTYGSQGEHLADCEVMAVVAGLMLKITGAEVDESEEKPEGEE